MLPSSAARSARRVVFAFCICLLSVLSLSCASDEVSFKPSPLPSAVEIADSGSTPSTLTAFVDGKAWLRARNVVSARVWAALGDDEFAATDLTPITEPDEFLWVRYEAPLPAMDAERGLRIYFEVEGPKETLHLPPTAPTETIGYSPNLPEFPASYQTPPQPIAVPRRCEPDPAEIAANEECAGVWTRPFPTMYNLIWKDASEATAIHSIQRGVGVDLGNGESYFWPYSIMLWHEGSNQSLGGLRTAMTYCPLTDTAVYFDTGWDPENLVKDDKLDVTGVIYNSNLVTGYRRRVGDGTLIPQMIGYAHRGDDQGKCLDVLPSLVTNWSLWVRLHPDTKVLEGDSVYDYYNYRQLGNPYNIYWKDHDEIRAPVCNSDERRPNKSYVMGFYGETSGPSCYILDATSFVRNIEIDDRPVTLIYLAGQKTAWALERVVDGEVIELQRAEHVWNGIPIYVDNGEVPSYWTPEGVAVAGPRAGARLAWVPSIYSFWFGWVANFPETEVIDPISGEHL